MSKHDGWKHFRKCNSAVFEISRSWFFYIVYTQQVEKHLKDSKWYSQSSDMIGLNAALMCMEAKTGQHKFTFTKQQYLL